MTAPDPGKERAVILAVYYVLGWMLFCALLSKALQWSLRCYQSG